jgi:hypothetical protein
MNWEPLYHDFLTQQWNMHFPAVQQFKQQLFHAENGNNRRFQAPVAQNLPPQKQYGMNNAYAQRPQQFAPVNYGSQSGGFGGQVKKKKVGEGNVNMV